MENDPLQQLRDVHMPADPSWWPPAIGWWILLVLVLCGLIWLVHLAIQAHRARRPLRLARAQHDALYNSLSGASPLVYAAQTNELLKRLLVHALGRQTYSPMSGEAWLLALDQESNSNNFSNGPGKILGHARFGLDPDLDVHALNRCVNDLLRSIRVKHD